MINFLAGLLILFGVVGSETIEFLPAILFSALGMGLMYLGTIQLNESEE
jgi:hypothetical protein